MVKKQDGNPVFFVLPILHFPTLPLKIRRRPPKSTVPEPKTRFCKTLIIIGVGNVAVLVHLNNQPNSQKGGF